MTLRHDVGALFVIGFHGTTVSAELREIMRDFRVGGVILFSRNCEDVTQVWELIGEIRAAAPARAPLIFVDEEGGPVSRLPAPVLRLPAMRDLGRLRDLDLMTEVGQTLGRELAAIGIDINLAPVIDVDSNPANPVIGRRALHDTPGEVARLGVALLQGLASGGVHGCPKHFPGHGDTSEDSHTTLPVLHHDRERLDQVELVPFRAVIAAGARMLMSAHVLLPQIDPAHPATLSPVALTQLLRRELGFDGIVLSDDLDMAAVRDRYTLDEMISLGILGSVDLFLLCNDVERQVAAMEAAVYLAEGDGTARKRMAERAARVRALSPNGRGDRPGRAPDARALAQVFDAPGARSLADRIAARLAAQQGEL